MVVFFFFFWRIFATWRQNKMAGESNKGISEIFFKNQFGEFSQPGDKKKGGLVNPTKGFLRFF
jgi:hypothetical protein